MCQAEPSLGENPEEKEKQEEETAVKEEEVKPPAVESEEVHNGEVETVDALQPSMTNVSYSYSPPFIIVLFDATCLQLRLKLYCLIDNLTTVTHF